MALVAVLGRRSKDLALEAQWFIDDSDALWARRWNGQAYTHRAQVRALQKHGVVVRGSANAPSDSGRQQSASSTGSQIPELTAAELAAVTDVSDFSEPIRARSRGARGPKALLVAGTLAAAVLGIAVLTFHGMSMDQGASMESRNPSLPSTKASGRVVTSNPLESDLATRPTAPEGRYAYDLHHNTTYWSAGSTSALASLAHSICEALRSEARPAAILATIQKNGVSDRDAAAAVGYAVGDVCPQYISQIDPANN